MSEESAPPAGPCLLLIFGASGDLTSRKLAPALYNLAKQGLLPQEFGVVGMARTPMPDEKFREAMTQAVRQFESRFDESVWRPLVSRFRYVGGDVHEPSVMEKVRDVVARSHADFKTGGNILIYLATAPELFAPIVQLCAKLGLTKEEGGRWARVVVEKPFGRDLASAQALNRKLHASLKERQIYRIDHYLGKETVQNILVLRFGNGIFEPVWNRRYVDHVQISVSEDLGVGRRAGYYDSAGALRDMVPNHIFQLITLTAMEPPTSFSADAVRDEQTKVLRAIQPLTPETVLTETVRGQYGADHRHAAEAPAYRDEPGVPKDSRTETFAAMRLQIDNWRWNGVPFYFRTGKRLACRSTEIVVQFKRVPHVLFRDVSAERLRPNQLAIRIQPNEGIALSFQAKRPGPSVRLGTVDMDFRYQDYFGQTPSTGYERLLYDAMLGDATLFRREDMVEACWTVVQPVLDVWGAIAPSDFPNYPAGSWGPKEADELLARDGRQWRPCAS